VRRCCAKNIFHAIFVTFGVSPKPLASNRYEKKIHRMAKKRRRLHRRITKATVDVPRGHAPGSDSWTRELRHTSFTAGR
jgi:hypothetical protein